MKNALRIPAKYVSFLAIILCSAMVTSASAAEVFTPEHIARLRSVISAEISPDGQHVAYVLSVPRIPGKDDNGPPWAELHVIGPDGVSRPFIIGDVNVGAVRWTPDGKHISLLAKRGKDEHRSLYVIPLQGGEARRVLAHEADLREYDWHPDSKTVVFLATEKEPEKKKKLSDKGLNAEVFEEELRDVRVWIGEADFVAAEEVEEPKALDLPGSTSGVTFSPDGKHIALALAPTPLIDDHYMKRRIRVVNTETGSITAQIENPGKLGQIAFSPDGKHLAVIAGEDLHDPAEGRLMIVPAAGGELRDLLRDYQAHVSRVAWKDNETIMYLADERVWTVFARIRLDGKEQKDLVPFGRAVLSGLSLSRDGQAAAMVGQSPKHTGEVFVIRHGDQAPKRFTDSNPWLDEMRFASQELVTYKARDGLEIEGLLIRPLDEEPGRRYPLIVVVHGGPEAHYSNGWLTRYASPGQVGAAQGYAVFYPNYRGSTGRGVAFSKMGQADYAGKEFDDLLDGVDHLISAGLVDGDRVGVTGGSYGGFATAWCSTYHSKRFAAGVMFVGISDHVSKSGTTDIPNEMTLVHARKRLWDDWDFFLERSPIRYVEQARTPLLILHGKEDTRVHPSQSMELYRHLRVLGKTPVRLVWYPGEGHGNRNAGSRYDYNRRMMRWFNHYLVGPGGDPPPPDLEYGFGVMEEVEKEEKEVAKR